ncbi:hypothetical protein HZA33_03450 [Candidatus Pacearchaeota archaeon]|nr:hypothetical protein [Candidatus Pacearchaeota archaeon]
MVSKKAITFIFLSSLIISSVFLILISQNIAKAVLPTTEPGESFSFTIAADESWDDPRTTPAGQPFNLTLFTIDTPHNRDGISSTTNPGYPGIFAYTYNEGIFFNNKSQMTIIPSAWGYNTNTHGIYDLVYGASSGWYPDTRRSCTTSAPCTLDYLNPYPDSKHIIEMNVSCINRGFTLRIGSTNFEGRCPYTTNLSIISNINNITQMRGLDSSTGAYQNTAFFFINVTYRMNHTQPIVSDIQNGEVSLSDGKKSLGSVSSFLASKLTHGGNVINPSVSSSDEFVKLTIENVAGTPTVFACLDGDRNTVCDKDEQCPSAEYINIDDARNVPETDYSSPLYRKQVFFDICKDTDSAHPERNGYFNESWQLFAKNVTQGCVITSNRFLYYCPGPLLTRAVVAIFLHNAYDFKSLPNKFGSDYFDDILASGISNTMNRSIGFIWEKKVTLGCCAGAECSGGTGTLFYCPNNYLTRVELAVFIVRTANSTDSHRSDSVCSNRVVCFNDIPSSIQFTDMTLNGDPSCGTGSPPKVCYDPEFINSTRWIKWKGITTGCTATTFCPTVQASRGMVAKMLGSGLQYINIQQVIPSQGDLIWADMHIPPIYGIISAERNDSVQLIWKNMDPTFENNKIKFTINDFDTSTSNPDCTTSWGDKIFYTTATKLPDNTVQANITWRARTCFNPTERNPTNLNFSVQRVDSSLQPISSSIDSSSITINSPDNDASPTAVIKVPKYNFPLTIYGPTNLDGNIFNIEPPQTSVSVGFQSDSQDADDYLIEQWKIWNDSTADNPITGTGRQFSSTFSKYVSGQYWVNLTVTEDGASYNRNKKASALSLFYVNQTNANDPPFTWISNPKEGEEFEANPIWFNATYSWDDETPFINLNFSWLFDDGVKYSAKGFVGANLSKNFSSPGPHWAKLKVIDNNPIPLSSKASVNFLIKGCKLGDIYEFKNSCFSDRIHYCTSTLEIKNTMNDLGACKGADNTYNTADDCCPRDYKCDPDPTINKCIPRTTECSGWTDEATCIANGCFWKDGICQPSSVMLSCSDYLTQELCETDPLTLGKEGGVGLGTEICGTTQGNYIITSCACKWVNNLCQLNYLLQKAINPYEPPTAVCDKYFSLTPCVDGKRIESWIATRDPTASEDPLCSDGSKEITCGFASSKLPFFGTISFIIAVALIVLYYSLRRR